MYKDSQTEVPYEEIDREIRELCRLINLIDGVETVSSCCGHHEHPCTIWLKVEDTLALTNLLFNFFDCDRLWHLELDNADVHRNWEDIHLLLHSGDIKDWPTVDLMISNLTYRFKQKLTMKGTGMNEREYINAVLDEIRAEIESQILEEDIPCIGGYVSRTIQADIVLKIIDKYRKEQA